MDRLKVPANVLGIAFLSLPTPFLPELISELDTDKKMPPQDLIFQ